MRFNLKFLTGADDILASAGAIKRQVVGPVLRFNSMFKKQPVQTLPTESNDPAERFKVAARVYAISDPEIERRTRVSAWLFWLSAAPIFPLLGLCGARAGDDDYSTAIIAASACLYCVTQALKNGFANYQFRTRSLVSFRAYLGTDMLPKFRSDRP
ncbi:hypothetical protein AAC691_17160 [Nguyenibacter vanlangensis]|uniref:Uncharacterized protein n=1 Tax=Nguyenibacter vanlangensis TaxID=1216886 RepID=A0ABZ3D2U2_9PROT